VKSGALSVSCQFFTKQKLDAVFFCPRYELKHQLFQEMTEGEQVVLALLFSSPLHSPPTDEGSISELPRYVGESNLVSKEKQKISSTSLF